VNREDGCAFSPVLLPSICEVGCVVLVGTPSFSGVLVLGHVWQVSLFPALRAYVLELLRNLLHENVSTGMLSGEECEKFKNFLLA